MATPDIVDAFLGATVGSGVIGPIFEKLIEGLKYVCQCKAECEALREQLEKIKPMLERICDEYKADQSLRNWLIDFMKCVERAQKVLEDCKSDSSEIWKRKKEVEYGVEILQLKDKICADMAFAPMALLSLQCGSNRGTCGIVQEVPKKILGMEDHFKRVKSLVLDGHKSEGSSCVGIRGMGGAGKTLLAQMVNNDKDVQRAFGEDSVIWITVGRDAELLVLYDRMRKRLQVQSDGGSIEDQCTELRNAFLRRQVLLILDDVWDGILHKCVEMVDWLNIARGPGSVTIITTRDESITRKCVDIGEEIILRLSEEQSWELFCTHAFGTHAPKLNKDMERVGMDVCKECKCLPLALKVLGRAMEGKSDIRGWRKTLRHLQTSSMVDRSVEQQLFRRLRFSYDQLEEPLKIYFLYFAAFSEDYDISITKLCQIWMLEGLFGEDLDVVDALDEVQSAVNELLARSLIDWSRIDEDEAPKTVKMHDILRDLANQIASEGNEYDRESLFLMEKNNLEEFRTNWLRSTINVKRLALRGKRIKRFLKGYEAPNLKICILYPNLPTHGIIDKHDFIIEDEFFMDLQTLRFLQIFSNSTLQKLPESMGRLGSLQHLDLSGCGALEQLPKIMGGLGSLQHLDLSWCRKLEQLPKSMGGLGSLQHLDLSVCEALKHLPESMGGLGSLQHLDLSVCQALKQLPESMGRLGSLQHLVLSMCYELKQLPKSMGGLGSLQHLDISRCYSLKQLSESMGGLGSLQHLDLSECGKLKQLPESMGRLGSLQHLDLSRCYSLEQLLESMGGLGSLQHLNLSEWKIEAASTEHGRIEVPSTPRSFNVSKIGTASKEHGRIGVPSTTRSFKV